MDAPFSPEHLDWFRKFKRVQMSGLYNMFDPRARKLTGLTDEQYSLVMQNYSALAEAAQKENDGHEH